MERHCTSFEARVRGCLTSCGCRRSQTQIPSSAWRQAGILAIMLPIDKAVPPRRRAARRYRSAQRAALSLHIYTSQSSTRMTAHAADRVSSDRDDADSMNRHQNDPSFLPRPARRARHGHRAPSAVAAQQPGMTERSAPPPCWWLTSCSGGIAWRRDGLI